MKNEGEKLFEDINLQYMEPLEGEEESEEQPKVEEPQVEAPAEENK